MTSSPLHLARTSSTFEHVNTLDLRLEVRKILLAEGLDFHNDDKYEEFIIPERLVDPKSSFALRPYPALDMEVTDVDHFAYNNYTSGVRYEIERTIDRARFREGLEDPDTFVLYGGHARFGRGPCFSPLPRDSVGPHWRTGLFRLGYPFIAIPFHDITGHGYRAPVVPTSVSLPAADCDPFLKRNLSKLKKKRLGDIADATLLALIDGLGPDDEVWTVRGFQHGSTDNYFVLFAGFENTDRAPNDLGATNIQCKGFFHCACATLPLNREIVVDRKGYIKADDTGYSFFTSDDSNMLDALVFLYHLLSYPEVSKGQPWEAALNYAVNKANKDLARDGRAPSRIRPG